jgi:hypothetical protein
LRNSPRSNLVDCAIDLLRQASAGVGGRRRRSVGRWPDATNEEVIGSLVPVATGLATVAAVTPPEVRAYHVAGPSSAADHLGRACVEILVHTDDALTGLGVAFAPPAELC